MSGPVTLALAPLPVSEKVVHPFPTSVEAGNLIQARDRVRWYPTSGANLTITPTQNPTCTFAVAFDDKLIDWSSCVLNFDVAVTGNVAGTTYLSDGWHSIFESMRLQVAGQALHTWNPGQGLAAFTNQRIYAAMPQSWYDNQGSVTAGLWSQNAIGTYTNDGVCNKRGPKVNIPLIGNMSTSVSYPMGLLPLSFFAATRAFPAAVCGETRLTIGFSMNNFVNDTTGMSIALTNLSLSFDVLTPHSSYLRGLVSMAEAPGAGLAMMFPDFTPIQVAYAGVGLKSLTVPIAADRLKALWVSSVKQAPAAGDAKSAQFLPNGFTSLQILAGGKAYPVTPITGAYEAFSELQRSVNGVANVHAGGVLDGYNFFQGNLFYTVVSFERSPESGLDVDGISTKSTGGSIIVQLNNAPTAPSQLFAVAEHAVPILVRERAVMVAPA